MVQRRASVSGLSHVVWLAALVAAAGCRCAPDESPGGSSSGSGSEVPELKLVVVLVIDQLPSWTFTRDAGQLDGGIARLLRESVYFPEVNLPYANTYTAPGHAAIATGAGPNQTGILANGWIRGEKRAYLPATFDPSYPIYDMSAAGLAGDLKTLAGSGASPVTQRLDGIVDVLAREKPHARSVVVGLKQRAAILMLGNRPTRAAWYEAEQVAMTSSTFYGEPPAWLTEFNRNNVIPQRFGQVWAVDDGPFLRRYTGLDDDAPGEGAGMGLLTTFPHSVEKSVKAPWAFRMMPRLGRVSARRGPRCHRSRGARKPWRTRSARRDDQQPRLRRSFLGSGELGALRYSAQNRSLARRLLPRPRRQTRQRTATRSF